MGDKMDDAVSDAETPVELRRKLVERDHNVQANLEYAR